MSKLNIAPVPNGPVLVTPPQADIDLWSSAPADDLS